MKFGEKVLLGELFDIGFMCGWNKENNILVNLHVWLDWLGMNGMAGCRCGGDICWQMPTTCTPKYEELKIIQIYFHVSLNTVKPLI